MQTLTKFSWPSPLTSCFPVARFSSELVFELGRGERGGKGKDGNGLASSKAFLIVIVSFLRTVHEGSSFSVFEAAKLKN